MGGCDDVEMQPRRRERVEVRGIRKEWKQFRGWQGQPELGFEFVNPHLFLSADLARPRSIPANTT